MSLSPIKVIHDDAQHAAALAEYEALLDADPRPETVEGDRFELLGLVIAAYEDQRWPIAPAQPREVLTLVMEGRGYSQADLALVLGSRSRASEILSGRRSLSVDHIRALNQRWGIPVAALIGTAEAA